VLVDRGHERAAAMQVNADPARTVIHGRSSSRIVRPRGPIPRGLQTAFGAEDRPPATRMTPRPPKPARPFMTSGGRQSASKLEPAAGHRLERWMGTQHPSRRCRRDLVAPLDELGVDSLTWPASPRPARSRATSDSALGASRTGRRSRCARTPTGSRRLPKRKRPLAPHTRSTARPPRGITATTISASKVRSSVRARRPDNRSPPTRQCAPAGSRARPRPG
jgi:hypothetical protein